MKIFLLVLLAGFYLLNVLECHRVHYPKHHRILILGAGMSGVAAGESLWDNGIRDFMVLEGQDYIGGRIFNIDFDGTFLPLGAGWIHVIGEDNPVWIRPQKYGVKVHFDNYSDFIVRDEITGKLLKGDQTANVSLHKAIKKVDETAEKLEKLGFSDIPLRTALLKEGWLANTPLKKAVEFFIFDFENGISTAVSSSIYYSSTGEGQDVIVTDERGYPFIVNRIAREFRHKIKLNTVVTEIEYSNDMVRVYTDWGEIYTADHVLVTFSSGVFNNNLVKYMPPLPRWKTDALALVPMGHYCKVFLKFPENFWDDNNYILLATQVRGDKVHWQNLDRKTLFPGLNVLVLTVTEEICLKQQLLSDEVVVNEIMEKLEKVYGSKIKYPTHIARSNWSYIPFILGAYANPTIGFYKGVYEALQAPIGTKLWFAGEHTAGEEDYAYTHGAYKSGKAQANALIKCIREGICPEYNATLTKKKL